MSRLIYKTITLIGFVSVLLPSNFTFAQNNQGQKPFHNSGTIVSIIPGQIVMKIANAGPVKIKFPIPGSDKVTVNGRGYIGASTTIKIQGKLHSSRVKKGMYVRFLATIDKKFVTTEEIKKLDIVDITEGNVKLGMYPDEADDESATGAISYMVVAKIEKIARSGEITFSLPKSKKNRRGKIKGSIAEDADISLSTKNIKIVMNQISKVKFDIKVAGVQINGPEVMAQDILITYPASYAQPLKGKKGKTTKKRPKKKEKPSGKKPKEKPKDKPTEKDKNDQSTQRKKNPNPKVIIIN